MRKNIAVAFFKIVAKVRNVWDRIGHAKQVANSYFEVLLVNRRVI